jgi:hypothetical protein
MPVPTTQKPRVAMDHARLNKFLDSPSTANSTRVQHAAEIKAQTKAPSWGGEKCDTRAFESRLAPPDDVHLTSDRRAQRLLATSNGIPASGLMVSHHVPVTTYAQSPIKWSRARASTSNTLSFCRDSTSSSSSHDALVRIYSVLSGTHFTSLP